MKVVGVCLAERNPSEIISPKPRFGGILLLTILGEKSSIENIVEKSILEKDPLSIRLTERNHDVL